jgi:tRNA dimethylallyltransferase
MNLFLDHCWFLTGPTASGKTNLSLALAQELNAEIISLDSMAIYRGMDIGTAKPSLAERAVVPHHLIDLRDPHEEFSVAQYRDLVTQLVQELLAVGKTPLFVGGTPLYLKALLRGFFHGPPADWNFRNEQAARAQSQGLDQLYAQLQSIDAGSAQRIMPNDERRIIRALEVWHLTGRTMTDWQQEFDQATPAAQCRVFVLDWPRAMLHERINQRVVQMFEQGLVAETTKILQNPHGLGRTAAQAVGYHEVIDYLAQRTTLDQAIALTQARTRQFAKRQLTWFRGLSECRWLARSPDISEETLLAQILEQGRSVVRH